MTKESDLEYEIIGDENFGDLKLEKAFRCQWGKIE